MLIATAEEMRQIEAQCGVSPEILMENAGRAVVAKLREVCPEPKSVLVVCGKGNNGGDGFVVARLIAQSGVSATCLVTCTEDQHGDLCRLQMERARAERRCNVVFADDDEWQKHLDGDYSIVVDAIFGTGLKSEPQGAAQEVIGHLLQHRPRILSVDVPSGIESDTGRELGQAIVADWTVVLGLAKPYLFQGVGAVVCGEWSVADIGLGPVLDGATNATLIEVGDIGLPPREEYSHKGDNGHVLILAGSRHYRGAATLAALGALRTGAGLVTVAGIEPVIAAVAAQVPEAILLPLPEDDGVLSPQAADTILGQRERFDAAVIGPGLTPHPNVRTLLETLWKDWWVPTVIDADALNLVAQGLALPSGMNILTPHPGEAARLLGATTNEVQDDRIGAARQLWAKFRWPFVLKGAHSLAMEDESRVWVNSTGNSGMATGGMGDVLSGVIAALLPAGGIGASNAGIKGMVLHGLAGDLAAQEIGKIGYSASDLAQFLPRARSILSK